MEINTLSDKNFQRLLGIKRGFFNKIVEILKIEETKKFALGGKTNKLSFEKEQLETWMVNICTAKIS